MPGPIKNLNLRPKIRRSPFTNHIFFPVEATVQSQYSKISLPTINQNCDEESVRILINQITNELEEQSAIARVSSDSSVVSPKTWPVGLVTKVQVFKEISLNKDMVKIEEINDSGGVPTSNIAVLPVLPKAEPLDIDTSSEPIQVKEEAGPSSSVSHLRLNFIGMGFSPALVDKVLQENGDGDVNSMLETLFTYSALEKPGAELSSSLEGLFSSDDDEEVQAPHGPVTENNLDSKPSVANTEKRSFLLSMNFSEREVDLALQQLGGETPMEHLVDHIVTAQTTGGDFQDENETKPSISGNVSLDEESNADNLYGVVEKTLYLLQMGFTEKEVSFAIENFGAHVPVTELADSILASRLTAGTNDVEDCKEYVFTGGANVRRETNFSTLNGETSYKPSTSNSGFYYENNNNEGGARPNKRAKNIFIHKTGPDNPFNQIHPNSTTFPFNRGMTGARAAPGPPFFIYGSTLAVSHATWCELSQFLYNIEPEFVNSQSFSAVIRKEGYIHNLPTETRHHIKPRPPTNIEGVMPYLRKWWPSWDPRKQLNGMIEFEMVGIDQLCKQLEKTVRDSLGAPSRESQTNILNKCNSYNLIWVGENKLGPLDPQQLELVMGYPVNHSSVMGADKWGRLKAMTQCFQTDTIGYILSPLKDIYPDGIRVLSIFSGIGGAEVALHRLGIHFKCLVSVESSDINRTILKRWWSNTERRGELRQLADISKLTIQFLEDLIREFGGFDLIIGAPDLTAGGGRGSNALNGLVGIDSNLFFEFVRVVQRVRSMMSKNN